MPIESLTKLLLTSGEYLNVHIKAFNYLNNERERSNVITINNKRKRSNVITMVEQAIQNRNLRTPYRSGVCHQYQGLNMQRIESDTKTPNTTSVHPNTRNTFNQPTGGQGSRIPTKHSTPNIGASPGYSNINWEHNHLREGETLCMKSPHTWTASRLSQASNPVLHGGTLPEHTDTTHKTQRSGDTAYNQNPWT